MKSSRRQAPRAYSVLGFVLAFGVFMLPCTASAQEEPSKLVQTSGELDGRFKTDILLVVAHPDDESAVAPYLARAVLDEGRRAAVVFLADGVGGFSMIGTERGEALGTIRAIEARAALGHLGISQAWFLGGRGTFSHNVLKSLASLDHGDFLERLVGILRLTRPEVVLTFVPAAFGDHGDHQASGVITTEAFDLAGDPAAFPAQLAFAGTGEYTQFGGLHPWQPKGLYYFTDAQGLELAASGPSYSSRDISPSRGLSYEVLAARSAAEHRSQEGFLELAKALERGEPISAAVRHFEQFYGFPFFPDPARFIVGKPHVQTSAASDLFSGLEPRAIPFEPPRRREAPPGSRSNEGVHIELGGPWSFYHTFWSVHGIEHLGRLQSPSTRMRPDEADLRVPLLLVNRTPLGQVVRVSATVPEGWEVTSGVGLYEVSANTVVPIDGRVRPRTTGAAVQGIAIWEAIVSGSVVGSAAIRVAVSRGLPQ